MTGQIDLGYEINKQKLYKIRLKKMIVVGAFYASFNKKAMFITKAHIECTGYLIRMKNWLEILNSNPEVSGPLKHKILTDFFNKIRSPMLLQKNRDIAAMKKKTDYNSLYNEVDLTLLEYIKL